MEIVLSVDCFAYRGYKIIMRNLFLEILLPLPKIYLSFASLLILE